MYTQKILIKVVIKVALSSNDDKRLTASDKITSYPYGYKGKQALV